MEKGQLKELLFASGQEPVRFMYCCDAGCWIITLCGPGKVLSKLSKNY